MSSIQSPVIVALDFSNADSALDFVRSLPSGQCRLKVGKELFTSAGPSFVEQLHKLGHEVFLDLKFHDIPNTVASAIRASIDLGVWMVNVHASGGRRMLEAAAEATSGTQTRLIGVTVLTSMDDADFIELGYSTDVPNQVLRLAALCKDCGLDGVVCSAKEATILRKAHPEQFELVTPGIRPVGSNPDDQRRIVTPEQAVADGATFLVIGRPITRADSPSEALAQINRSLGIELE